MHPLWHIIQVSVCMGPVSCPYPGERFIIFLFPHMDCSKVAACRWEIYSRGIGVFKDYLHCPYNNTPHSLLLHALECTSNKNLKLAAMRFQASWNNFTLMNLRNRKGPSRSHTSTNKEIRTIKRAPSEELYDQTLRKSSCIPSVYMQPEKDFFLNFLKGWNIAQHLKPSL